MNYKQLADKAEHAAALAETKADAELLSKLAEALRALMKTNTALNQRAVAAEARAEKAETENTALRGSISVIVSAADNLRRDTVRALRGENLYVAAADRKQGPRWWENQFWKNGDGVPQNLRWLTPAERAGIIRLVEAEADHIKQVMLTDAENAGEPMAVEHIRTMTDEQVIAGTPLMRGLRGLLA